MSEQDIERSMWSDDEVYVLLGIWCDASVMGKLDGTCRNAQVYKEIVKRMGDKGFVRTVNQVKYKMKNLKKEYRKLIDHNNRSGRERKTIKFEEELSLILGDRPSANPVCVMEAGSVSLFEATSTEDEDDDDEEAVSAPTITYIGEEIDVESDSQESTNDEDGDIPQGPSSQGLPLPGSPPFGSPPPGSPPSGSRPVSEVTESTPGPSGTRRKRPTSSEYGGSKPKQGHGSVKKSVLDDLQKVIQKSDSRYYHEERKRDEAQRESDEKWRRDFLDGEKRVVDCLTSFMSVMTDAIGQRASTPGTTWSGPVPTTYGGESSQVGPQDLNQAQTNMWHYGSARIGSAYGYSRQPPRGFPTSIPIARSERTDASTPGLGRPRNPYVTGDPRFTHL